MPQNVPRRLHKGFQLFTLMRNTPPNPDSDPGFHFYAVPGPDPAVHFDADPDPASQNYADPDPQYWYEDTATLPSFYFVA
jgi:hypothetical protein